MNYRQEPLVNLKVGPQGSDTTFMVDSGAERSSVIQIPPGARTGTKVMGVSGIGGKTIQVPIVDNVEVGYEDRATRQDLLLLPSAGFNLLGRDLQVQLGIGTVPSNGEIIVKLFALKEEDDQKIEPEVWYREGNRGGLNISPLQITLLPDGRPVRRKQYPIAMEGRKGLQLVIEGLIADGLLEECMSPYNTPILPVRKPDGTYWMVQDLRGLNAVVQTRYPVVPNPYTLMSKISPDHEWFSVIDLKDAFWSCPLEESSRDMFAFEWENPTTGRKRQLRWTVLPQGFTESPNLFGQVLQQVLAEFQCAPESQLLQYVDDLLLSGPTQEGVQEDTIRLLNFLGKQGLRVSKKKLQFVEKEVRKKRTAMHYPRKDSWNNGNVTTTYQEGDTHQLICDALDIEWKYHTPWHPQSSGRVERMNSTLKAQLTKLMLETKLPWTKCLPIVLLRIRTAPRKDIGISPYEMLFGLPYWNKIEGYPTLQGGDLFVKNNLLALSRSFAELRKKGLLAQTPLLDFALHQIVPGDWVLVRTWKPEKLQPQWEGPFQVLLTTEAAVRTKEKGWTHASRVKGPVKPESRTEWTCVPGEEPMVKRVKKTTPNMEWDKTMYLPSQGGEG
ncbi:uncharacterized protein [Hemitrygon akajei]|uniref:uncharacterized protein n=1 Tax=Hemitrygon akajei TaxID=2704970 RepID=UPI003BFA102A